MRELSLNSFYRIAYDRRSDPNNPDSIIDIYHGIAHLIYTDPYIFHCMDGYLQGFNCRFPIESVKEEVDFNAVCLMPYSTQELIDEIERRQNVRPK